MLSTILQFVFNSANWLVANYQTILLVVFSLVGLIILHEFGHFLLAKKFGVKVEEFGIFLPPRIWGKQIGETLWSINWIPAGAFVKLKGEDGPASPDEAAKPADSDSFGSKPIWQRMLIIAGGVISFWLVSIVIYSFVYATSAVGEINDDEPATDAWVQILDVAPGSPAETAGILRYDIVEGVAVKSEGSQVTDIDKMSQLREITNNNRGKEILLSVKRGQEHLQLTLVPRENPPAGEGVMGVQLARIATRSYSWDKAILKGVTNTWYVTRSFFDGWGMLIGKLINHEKLPAEAQLVGPLGIGVMMGQVSNMGINFYLQFVATISVYLAVFNALPIPALDGGRFFFLLVEWIRKKPAPVKLEQGLTTFFFMALMIFALIVTVMDIRRLF